jgi:diguanylate cyclase (GGDEF)-like protein
MKRIIKQIYIYLNNASKLVILILSFILFLFVAAVDFYFGLKITLSLFYLIPLSFSTWFINKSHGLFFSILSALFWIFIEFYWNQFFKFREFLIYWDIIVKFIFFLIFVNILSLFKETLENSEKNARNDFLTGVINARYFYELAQSEINRANRYNSIFSFAYIDLDNFKYLNDNFGHPVGDALLRVVADIIKDNLRKTDIIARLGGDEFAILLPETGYEQSNIVIKKITKEIKLEMERFNWPITLSTGLVTFEKKPISADEMIKIADDIMYSAKKNGKDLIKRLLYKD